MRRMLAALLIVSFAAPAFAGPYLFELLEIEGYRKGFGALLSHEKSLPAWVKTFAKTMNGVSTPSQDIEVNGGGYVLASVCKPHDCWGNMLYVVFANGGEEAWGLLEATGDDGVTHTRLLGKPDKAMTDALKTAASN